MFAGKRSCLAPWKPAWSQIITTCTGGLTSAANCSKNTFITAALMVGDNKPKVWPVCGQAAPLVLQPLEPVEVVPPHPRVSVPSRNDAG